MVSTVHGISKNDEKTELLRAIRTERYACQSVAKLAVPNERVNICLRRPVGQEVEVWKHQKTEKAFYTGLMVCGSVWTCPVCAAKISERRKNELKQAISQHKASGGRMALLTLTFSHKRTDKLKTTLKRFSEATTKFMTYREYHEIRKEMGIIGRVKVTEVTHGDNGYHPHAHIAIFYTNEVNLIQMQLKMYRLWSNACEKVGLKTARNYGLDLQGAEEVAAYLSKHGNWSLEQELSKAHIKKAKHGSMTPFDFLRAYLETEDDKYLKLFAEYVECFKGKRQVHWSRGLKDHFELEDKTDEEVAKEIVEQADVLGRLSFDEWKQILRTDQRAQLLTNIEKFGFDIGLKFTLNSI